VDDLRGGLRPSVENWVEDWPESAPSQNARQAAAQQVIAVAQTYRHIRFGDFEDFVPPLDEFVKRAEREFLVVDNAAAPGLDEGNALRRAFALVATEGRLVPDYPGAGKTPWSRRQFNITAAALVLLPVTFGALAIERFKRAPYVRVPGATPAPGPERASAATAVRGAQPVATASYPGHMPRRAPTKPLPISTTVANLDLVQLVGLTTSNGIGDIGGVARVESRPKSNGVDVEHIVSVTVNLRLTSVGTVRPVSGLTVTGHGQSTFVASVDGVDDWKPSGKNLTARSDAFAARAGERSRLDTRFRLEVLGAIVDVAVEGLIVDLSNASQPYLEVQMASGTTRNLSLPTVVPTPTPTPLRTMGLD